MFVLAMAIVGSPGSNRSIRNVTVTANQMVSRPRPILLSTNDNNDIRTAPPYGGSAYGGSAYGDSDFVAEASETGLTIDSSSDGLTVNPLHSDRYATYRFCVYSTLSYTLSRTIFAAFCRI